MPMRISLAERRVFEIYDSIFLKEENKFGVLNTGLMQRER
jgi:hypothetical protein